MSAEHEMYLAMFREGLRRAMAEEDVNDLHNWLTETLLKMGGKSDGDGVLWWEDTFAFYDALLAKREADAAVPASERKALLWPWASWNRMIDPLPPGMLAVISAGDGMGKTAYAEMMAETWASHGNQVVFVHYELAHAVMMDRRYSRRTNKMTVRELKSGELTSAQRQLVNDAHEELRSMRGGITYQHSAGWTMERTVARLRQLKADGLCDVVVIDYLEKNAASRRQLQMFGSSPYQREADNVEQIKNFAELTETPVVLLAQMSKAGKSADFSDIDRTSMRGAGEKSEKANVVVLLHRDKDDSAEGAYSNTVNVRVDKNTLGPTGKFVQWMRPETFSVYDVDTVRTELN